jgi:hypothetical protein
VALALAVAGAAVHAGPWSWSGKQHFWSPYYRIDYEPQARVISVNLIGHQEMISRDDP